MDIFRIGYMVSMKAAITMILPLSDGVSLSCMQLMQCLLHDAHAAPRWRRVTLVVSQWRWHCWLLTRTKSICAPRLGILYSRWMIAMRSLMAMTMRQLATQMSTGNSRFDMSRPRKCRGLRGCMCFDRSFPGHCRCMRPGRRRFD